MALAAACAVALAGCSTAAQHRALGPGDVVATVGSATITLAQLDEKALQQAATNFGAVKLSQALYDARRTALLDMIDDLLIDQEARARHVDRAALVQQEIAAKAAPVTEADISSFFDQNRSRLQGVTLEQAHEAIRTHLAQQRSADRRETFVAALRAKTAIRVALEPPRQLIAKADRPSQGPENAPIEIVEFSDFQCPYCEAAFPTVKTVLSTYGDRIHFVYRHFPLNIHPQARPAAEAAQCAAEQGKFWPFHDALFGDQSKLGDSDLKATAARLGMNSARFDQCVDSHKYRGDVDADLRAGEEAGVNGTPAFYINGRLLSGAQPLDTFKQVIDEELNGRR